MYVVSRERTHSCMHTVVGSLLAQVHHDPGFSSLHRRPLARPSLERGHILQGVSKQRWHVDVLARDATLGSLPPHLTPLPEKQPRLFSFPSFFLLFFFSFPVNCSAVPEKTESLFVFNGCSIPQVYPDLKIPTKWGAGLTTRMMLMLIWVCHCIYCPRSSLCHFALNGFSLDWHVCTNLSFMTYSFIAWQHNISSIYNVPSDCTGQTTTQTVMDNGYNELMNE